MGDGATVTYWTDRKAYDIIRRTANTLTLRRCKATLKPEFKPIFVSGGFSAHCINQYEQDYDYAPDENGAVVKAYWSEKRNGFFVRGSLRVIPGRHEFYDYNF